MFDGLLGRGFAPKGKPLIKLTKNRIDVLRRKRTATIKFLKKDLADLVINGHDHNAFSRAGGLLDELRYLWSLDFVEQTCDFVYKQLSTMQKTPECPEDCREAVSSLMFAASGFSELPELRELRQMFHEKYTDSLALFVNQELVENMSSKPFSLEQKVKLMEDVASEYSIRWDSKDFEKRIVRHNSISVKETPKSTYDKYKPVNRNMPLPKREEFEGSENGVSLNRKMAEASERRDPLFQSDKESYQNGLRGNYHGLTSKERSDNVRHASRSESKDNKAERKEFYLHSKQDPAREKHQPIFNEGDTIVMKVNRENLGQGNGHRPGVVDAHKKTEVVASERKEYHMQSKQEPSRERHQPIFNEGDTIVMKVKHENHVQGNGHQNGVVDLHKKTEVIASEKLKPSSTKRADKLVIGFKQESFFQGYKHEKNEEHAHQKVEDNTSRPPKPSSKSKRTESIDPGSRHRNDWESKENAVLVGKSTEEDPSGGNVKGGVYENDYANPARKVEERETERMKSPFYKSLPPPYVKKSSAKARNEKAEASDNPKARFDGEEGNHPDNDKNVYGAERGNEAGHHEVNDIDNPSLKRRTSRRKHIVESGGDDHTRSRRRDARKGLQVLIDEDEKDSEEKMMDKLLMHYSKKPSSYEKDNVQQESKSRRTHLKKGESDEEMMIYQPARSRSLPPEHLAGPSEPAKTFARAASFQPERSSEAKHVHPKLPNYDDLAARFAELKGR
ncbi:Vacuolar protein sorting-associated protein Ist1 [Arabidopsis thaliana x Arabidopsis arenosa]|uniref:Vacuolar protein sorting-associated protein Ist1 n=1 Tax=Arabidopsis thaliana x Arabidopsis arenosa TaxID=1240361 RepID=A0A8T1Y2T2_9BRAS|nr:Vacuolar protein sorting-associated protein Ist1 [Arabidopsis thaliana x Arabidopsis arenosa]